MKTRMKPGEELEFDLRRWAIGNSIYGEEHEEAIKDLPDDEYFAAVDIIDKVTGPVYAHTFLPVARNVLRGLAESLSPKREEGWAEGLWFFLGY
jgi:hypothetical protein